MATFEAKPRTPPSSGDTLARGNGRGEDGASRPASHFVEAGTVRLHYLVAPPRHGTSPVLLLIHGTGGNAASWTYQLRGLRDAASPMAVDLPGHGISGRIASPSIPGYAAAVAETMARLAPGRFFVAGHSLGGAVALELALRYPRRVRGLILIATGAHFPALAATPNMFLLPAAVAPGKFRDLFLGEGVSAEALALARAAVAGCPPDIIRADIGAAKAFDVRSALSGLRRPALILCGTEDHITPPRYAAWLREGLADGELVLIQGAGHMLPLERPEQVNAALARFLRGQRLLRRLLRGAGRAAASLFRRRARR
ncbi:MAG TPA: alpha/beta fold hydrolase [Candidatus Methylomirabilis sp.]|nr:alpha/beta fold hydrolase [Candidatus Methylomirabilis sp.]